MAYSGRMWKETYLGLEFFLVLSLYFFSPPVLFRFEPGTEDSDGDPNRGVVGRLSCDKTVNI